MTSRHHPHARFLAKKFLDRRFPGQSAVEVVAVGVKIRCDDYFVQYKFESTEWTIYRDVSSSQTYACPSLEFFDGRRFRQVSS